MFEGNSHRRVCIVSEPMTRSSPGVLRNGDAIPSSVYTVSHCLFDLLLLPGPFFYFYYGPLIAAEAEKSHTQEPGLSLH